jgi:hypothetical protein
VIAIGAISAKEVLGEVCTALFTANMTQTKQNASDIGVLNLYPRIKKRNKLNQKIKIQGEKTMSNNIKDSRTNEMPKMRTISAAIREIKESDPHSCFTEHALRKAVKEDLIHPIKAGKKYLVDMDVVYAYLKHNFPAA